MGMPGTQRVPYSTSKGTSVIRPNRPVRVNLADGVTRTGAGADTPVEPLLRMPHKTVALSGFPLTSNTGHCMIVTQPNSGRSIVNPDGSLEAGQ